MLVVSAISPPLLTGYAPELLARIKPL